MFSNVKYLDGDQEETANITRPGKVIATFENGDTFEGTYINAGGARGFVRSGQGRYVWGSNAVYEGEYNDGKREGQGSYTFPSGEIYEGTWKGGMKHGKGKYSYTNGDVFYGMWVGDKRHGQGRFINASDKTEIVGEWKNGLLIDSTFKEKTLAVAESDSPPGSADSPAAEETTASTEQEAPETSATDDAAATTAEDVEKTTSAKPFGVVIAGAPASGKGTQCEKISSGFGFIHLSSGDMLRAAVASGSEAGKRAKTYMEQGDLVPDDLVIKAVRERLEKDDVLQNGFLLDGFPRTKTQAEELKKMGLVVDICLMLEVDDEVLVKRAVGRRMDPETGKIYHLDFFPPPDDEELKGRLVHRKDDTEEAMRNRLVKFKSNVESLKEFYSGVSHIINGDREKELVWKDIKDIIEKTKASQATATEG